MKESLENKKNLNESNSNQSQAPSVRNSAKIKNSYDSSKIVNKQLTNEKLNKSNDQNFIKRNSPPTNAFIYL